jgi:thymidylate synthase (FAD)
MTEQNLFQPIATSPIYADGIGHVTLYDASHANESEEQRIWTVTTTASLAYGNEEAKNPEALYERMKSIKHESLWEFIRYGKSSTMNWSTISQSMRAEYPHFMNEYGSQNHKESIACFRIKVPIFVARQFMRHRSFSYLEMSRRYTKDAKVPFEFWFPREFDKEVKFNAEFAWEENLKSLCEMGYHTQVASRFLPQTTYTEFYVMGEVEGLKNFFRLRLDEHAQAEIREVAEAMLTLLEQHQPELALKTKPE